MFEQPGSGRLDADTIAAYLDGQLPPEARAVVEARMAADPETYEWVVNAVRTREELEFVEAEAAAVHDPLSPGYSPALITTLGDDDEAVEEDDESEGVFDHETAHAPGRSRAPIPDSALPPTSPALPRVLPFYKRRAFKATVGAALAAAAVLVVMVRVAPERTGSLRALFFGAGGDVDPRFEKLVAAVGEERYVEGRLTGGFKYGPLRSVTRGPGDLSNQNLALLAAAGELQKAAQADPSAENLHAWGVAQLLLGEARASATTLSQARNLQPKASYISIDLAAALLDEATRTNSAEGLVRALELIETVLRTNERLPEAHYNKALILEELGMSAEARATWARYLELDPESSWSDTARERLRTIGSASALDPDLSRLLVRLRPYGEPAGSDAQAVREFLENSVLGSPQFPDLGIDALQSAREASAKLAIVQGDGLLADTVLRLFEDAASPRSRVLRSGMRCLSTARAMHSESRTEEMGATASECFRHFEAAGSHYSAWTMVLLARAASHRGDLATSRRLAEQVVQNPAFQAHSVVHSWALLQLGGIFFLQRDYVRALDLLERSASGFASTREPEHAAGVHELMASTLLELGDTARAWQHYRAALQLLPFRANSVRRFATRTGVALGGLSSGYPLFATLLLTSNMNEALAADAPSRIAESHRYLSQASMQLGDSRNALQHLKRALSVSETVADPPMRSRLMAEIHMGRAQLQLHADPVRALVEASEAARSFEGLEVGPRSLDLVVLQLEALVRLGRLQEADSLISEGMRLVGQLEARVSGRWARAQLHSATAALHKQSIRIEVLRGQAEAAFLRRERARQRAATSIGRTIDELRQDLPAGTAVLAFSIDEHSVYRWHISNTSWGFRALPYGAAPLRQEGELLRAQLRKGRLSDSPLIVDVLAGDLPDEIRTASRWVVLPDGPLGDLPLAAIAVEANRPLIDAHELILADTVEGYLGSENGARASQLPGSSAAVIASPENAFTRRAPLRRVAREANLISALYKVTPAQGPRATLEEFGRALTDASVVHFAGHAIADTHDASRSHLVLSPSVHLPTGLLDEESISLMRIRSDVIVLAACSTAAGVGNIGTGLGSLAGAFVWAGASWVVGTLWDVEDDSVSNSFVELHMALSQGVSPGAALQRVQQRAWRAGANPWHWAPLIVIAG